MTARRLAADLVKPTVAGRVKVTGGVRFIKRTDFCYHGGISHAGKYAGEFPRAASMNFPSPAADLGLILRCAAFAAHRHRDQRRKDAEASPYINHPLALADVLANEAGVTDATVLCAALLHDTVEDTRTTKDELAAAFGPEIAAVVMEVTDDKLLHKDERKRLQVVHAPTLSGPAKQVELADKICNLRDILHAPPVGWNNERKRAYFEWSKQVIDGLRGSYPILEAIFDAEYAKCPW